MGKLLCWLGLHYWEYARHRQERAILDIFGNSPMLTYKVYRCGRCGKEMEEMEF
jgi:hypothetical protein